MRRLSRILALLLLWSLWAAAARTEPVVDQQCLPELWGWYAIQPGAPIGQGFVPAFAEMTFAELWVINEPASNDDTARVFVVVHADSIQGPALAASRDVWIPKPWDDAVRFEFPEPVALEPGHTYVLVVLRWAGPGNPAPALG